MKIKVILAVVVGIVAGVGVAAVLHATKADAQPSAIPVGSTLAIAKAHSQGALPACLAKSGAAETAVRKDDAMIGGGSYPATSAFDLAATMGIVDVPAGTNVDVTMHSYDGKTVTGSIAYPAKYGSYNVTIVPNSKAKPYTQWTMTSLVACK